LSIAWIFGGVIEIATATGGSRLVVLKLVLLVIYIYYISVFFKNFFVSSSVSDNVFYSCGSNASPILLKPCPLLMMLPLGASPLLILKGFLGQQSSHHCFRLPFVN
jgi:hypothetical protein